MTPRALLLAWLAIFGFTAPALAHAFLQQADPGAGAVLARAPKEIVLSFSESLETDFSHVDVTDAAGGDMQAGPSVATGHLLRVLLKPLRPGSYRVRWYAVARDNHRTEGAYGFSVGP